MFAPERGAENPIIRRALALCEEAGMKVTYHPDTVEVWFSATNKRFYTVWSQFLADAEVMFGAKLHEAPADAAPARNGFGHRNGAANGFADSLPNFDHGDPPETASMKRELKILERAIKVVGMQRDEWKREAERLREELDNSRSQMANMLTNGATLSPGTAAAPDRYRQVRQIIARRLHPDVPGSDDEKAYREKLFKSIWQEIEVLDRKG